METDGIGKKGENWLNDTKSVKGRKENVIKKGLKRREKKREEILGEVNKENCKPDRMQYSRWQGSNIQCDRYKKIRERYTRKRKKKFPLARTHKGSPKRTTENKPRQ